MVDRKTIERFWKKAQTNRDLCECWKWLGYRMGGRKREYGGFRVSIPERRIVYAHRFSYCLFHGLEYTDIKGKVIRHKCDNPLCVNPIHLEPGTQADNVADMIKRKGPNRASSKLTENQVRDIKKRINSGETHRIISEDYPICRATVSQIARGVNWRHV